MTGDDITPDMHRALGKASNGRVWDLLANDEPLPDEASEMVHAAHASAWHWQHGGDAANVQRGEWLVSHVYAVLGRAEPALVHARRCLEITETEAFDGFDRAYAYEAMARATAIARDPSATEWRARAQDAGERIADAEDRALFEADLGAEPWS